MIKPIVAPSDECETLTLFLNCQTTIVIRIIAKWLGHPQPATPTRVYNTTTNNFVYNNLQQKKSKSFDMRLHWLRDRINNSQFKIHWMKWEFNYAYYYFKQHTEAHHKKMRPMCLVSQATTHHKNARCFTPRNLSANIIVNSQKPLSTTMGVLLKCGL